MKICTVVVTFNRYGLLTECLDSLLNQTSKNKNDILLIDNASTDGTDKRIIEDGYLDKKEIIYKRLEKNTGGAGGFYFGVKYAQENNYDYVWLMDDDAEPELNALELLVNNLDDKKYSAYAPKTLIGTKENHILSTHGHRAIFDYENCLPAFQKAIDLKEYDKKICEIEMASFVGIFIPLSSVEQIGLPEERFFIHHDDTEYSLRLSTLGKILMINDSRIYHKEKRQEEKIQRKFLWFKKNRIKYERLWLKYFGLRNSVFIAFKYGKGIKRYFLAIKLYLELIKDIILYDDKKCIRIVFATNSFFDGVREHFDNEKPSKILKGK